MIQYNQIGKYRKKESILNAKKGLLYITPENREYTFIDFKKVGRTYIFTLQYKSTFFDISEKEYMNSNDDSMLSKFD